MATLIPALSTCVSRMTSGEKRLAQRLEQKLEEDYLCWYDVPIGPHNLHPDFIVLHPRRGILILEVKDWKKENLIEADKESVKYHADRGIISAKNPLEQARQYAHAVIDLLEKDDQLVFTTGSHKGRPRFPWSYGLVLPNISRKTFDEAGFDNLWPSHQVICQDEMTESVDDEAFQQRLWQMFKIAFNGALTLPQIDRIRWHIFPQIRIPQHQAQLFDEKTDVLRVMDLTQEQLARSLGDGHRVIHGVAGSGKTLILGYRAEQLAQVSSKPILVLCYNTSLAKRLGRSMIDKGLGAKVLVHNFHQWCRAQLVAFNAGLPAANPDKEAYFAEMVNRVIASVDRGLIPAAQYEAVLIDEGHDFQPHWFKLVVQMLDPRSNSLLVLYDDAQSIYAKDRKRKFSFKSVGIQAQGRTTLLRVNYRNTQEILRLARSMADDVLRPKEADEDGAPTIDPIGGGDHGPDPQIINFPTLREEACHIADRFKAAHNTGTPWRDMAVIYHDYAKVGKEVLATLRSRGIPVTFHKEMTFAETEDTVKVLTMHSCKGLEFPLVAIPGVGLLGADEASKEEDARLLYVAMTRATRELVMSSPGRA
ncbi:MAG TPA: 3'-5' exonuclease [Rhodocyclaceae bacterium]|nr:3'-5' exonuclease [Rhodocyclaceae bacterium]